MQSSYRDADVLIVIGVLRFKPSANRIHLRASLLNAHSRFEPAPDIEIISAAHFSRIFVSCQWMRRNVPRRWNPKLSVVVRRKAVRHHPDDGENFAIQNHFAANHISLTAETALPQFAGENSYMIVPRTCVLFR